MCANVLAHSLNILPGMPKGNCIAVSNNASNNNNVIVHFYLKRIFSSSSHSAISSPVILLGASAYFFRGSFSALLQKSALRVQHSFVYRNKKRISPLLAPYHRSSPSKKMESYFSNRAARTHTLASSSHTEFHVKNLRYSEFILINFRLTLTVALSLARSMWQMLCVCGWMVFCYCCCYSISSSSLFNTFVCFCFNIVENTIR